MSFYKEEDTWYLVNRQYRWQAKIKGDDFLLNSIRKEKQETNN